MVAARHLRRAQQDGDIPVGAGRFEDLRLIEVLPWDQTEAPRSGLGRSERAAVKPGRIGSSSREDDRTRVISENGPPPDIDQRTADERQRGEAGLERRNLAVGELFTSFMSLTCMSACDWEGERIPYPPT